MCGPLRGPPRPSWPGTDELSGPLRDGNPSRPHCRPFDLQHRGHGLRGAAPVPPPWDSVSPYPGANRALAPSVEYLISHLLIVPSAKSLRGGMKRGGGSVLPAFPAPPPRCPLSLCRFAGRAAASPSLASAECHLTQAARASLSPYQPFCSSHLRGGGGREGWEDGRERLWGGGELCARSQPPHSSSPIPSGAVSRAINPLRAP